MPGLYLRRPGSSRIVLKLDGDALGWSGFQLLDQGLEGREREGAVEDGVDGLVVVAEEAVVTGGLAGAVREAVESGTGGAEEDGGVLELDHGAAAAGSGV